jgi:hypothetical protein
MLEITITVKNEEKTYKEKILRYESLTLHHQDKDVLDMVATALKNANFEAQDIVIKINMVIQ